PGGRGGSRSVRAVTRRAMVAFVLLTVILAAVLITFIVQVGGETLGEVARKLQLYLFPSAVILMLLAITLYLQVYIHLWFESRKGESHPRLVTTLEYIVLYFVFFLVFVAILLVLRVLLPEDGGGVLWAALTPTIPYPFFAIFVALLFVAAGEVVDSFGRRMKSGKEDPLAVSFIDFAVLVFRYFLYALGILVATLLELAFFGWDKVVIEQVLGFFIENYRFLVFIGVFVLLAWFGYKMVADYIDTVHSEQRRAHPEMYRMEVTAVRYIFALMVFLVVTFSILRMAGLEMVGFIVVTVTLVIVVIGVYVLTTSRPGNLVAGFMLVNEKPFDIGDRIMFEGRECTVHDVGKVYTEFRTGEGSVISVPNATVLGTTIENLTRAKRRVSSVDFLADAELPVRRIREAATMAGGATPGVERVEAAVAGVRGRQIEYRIKITMNLDAKEDEATASVLHDLAKLVVGTLEESREDRNGRRLPVGASDSGGQEDPKF
ncbi:MAG TPA: mechanosensitive ion channel domain-containing protein, partial [Thermoplasmata archaeon]|nr:mechanosensitive ion channel domain-containing protein [Thermoplasmata archaeon]